jgi:hypothetical protein
MSISSPSAAVWRRSIGFLIACIAIYILSPTVADPDLWGHVRFGQDTMAEGSIPRVDPYSYMSAGTEWINHEWLSEVLFAAVHEVGGTRGLVFLKVAVSMLIAWLLYGHLRREGLEQLPAGIVLAFVSFMMIPGLITVRPPMFTFLFFLMTLLLLHAGEHGKPSALWFLPLVMAVWINFHGGVLAGLGLVAIWGGARFFAGIYASESHGDKDSSAGLEGPSHRAVGPLMPVLVGLASGLALLLNPYGWKLPWFLVRTATIPRPDISEWQAIPLSTPRGALYLIAVGVGLYTLLRSRRRRSMPLTLVFAVVAMLPVMAVRHLQLLALSFGVLIAGHLADVWAGKMKEPRIEHRPDGSRPPALRLLPAFIGVTLFVAVSMIAASVPNFRCVVIDPQRAIGFPVHAVGIIEDSGVEGNLAIHFDWGEYALWHLAPDVLISMDGRRETVYSDSIYEQYLEFQNGLGDWDSWLEERPADMALVSRHWPTYNLVQLKPEFTLVYEDSLSGLFARAGTPVEAALRNTPVPDLPLGGTGRCAP